LVVRDLHELSTHASLSTFSRAEAELRALQERASNRPQYAKGRV
jgi:hypothetical protein